MAQAHTYANLPVEKNSYSLYELELVDSTHQISVAQLLGRDYLFLPSHIEFSKPNFNHEVTRLLQDLGLQNEHTVVVSVTPQEGKPPLFVRHDLTWYHGKAGKVVSIPIANKEQQDFMSMLWDCSTSIQANLFLDPA